MFLIFFSSILHCYFVSLLNQRFLLLLLFLLVVLVGLHFKTGAAFLSGYSQFLILFHQYIIFTVSFI